jgi:iron(III) transport system ATP-binding protein
MYYLGDINDCRIDVGGGTIVRVIADSHSYDLLKEGQTVSLQLLEFIVYPDTGDDTTKIIT